MTDLPASNGSALSVVSSNPEAIDIERPGRKLLQAFLRARNPNTMRAYQRDLADFARFYGCPGPEEAMEKLLRCSAGRANEAVLNYRGHLVERKLTSATVNRRLAALRSMSKLGRMLGIIPWTLEVESLDAQAYRDTAGPGETAVAAMLEQAEGGKGAAGIRDTAIVRLLHDLALRRGELVGLDREHFDPRRGLSVLGKGRTARIWLTMPPATQAALEAWLEVRGDDPGPMFTALAQSAFGHRLTGAAVYAIIRKLGLRVGVVTRPHGLRHTGITRALDMTSGDVRKVQRFSRHRSMDVLLRYDDNRKDLGGEVSALVSLPSRAPATAWEAFVALVAARAPGRDPLDASPRAVATFLRARSATGRTGEEVLADARELVRRLRAARPASWPRGVVPAAVGAALAAAGAPQRSSST